jgi:hypothetical protein
MGYPALKDFEIVVRIVFFIPREELLLRDFGPNIVAKVMEDI